jgi:hypothetical protein
MVPYTVSRGGTIGGQRPCPLGLDGSKRQTDNESRNVSSLSSFPRKRESRDPRTEPVALDRRLRGGDGNPLQTRAPFSVVH